MTGVASTPTRLLSTVTERNWLVALGLVIGSSLLFLGIIATENALAGRARPERLVWHAVETSMRYLALAHFIVAIVYMATSRTFRRLKSWIWFAGLAGVGVLLSWAFHAGGALQGALAAALFYGYFMVHDFRDQMFFFHANRDGPEGVPKSLSRPFLWAVPLLVFGGIAATFLVGAAFRIGGARRYTDGIFHGLATTSRAAIALTAFLTVLGLTIWALRRCHKTFPGGLAAFGRTYRPILIVFLAVPLILIFDILITGRVYAIVTLHVTAWYVFVDRQLASRPAGKANPKSWAWWRSSRMGFNLMHGAVVLALLAAGIVWAYGFRNDPQLAGFHALLSREAFPYWTIMHVTVSFVPRG